jgi:hypothetical protein
VVEAGPNQTLCSQVIPYTLSGFSPTANGVGVWSGSTQLVGNIYTPSTTPVLDVITYTFTDLNGCINVDSLLITTLAPGKGSLPSVIVPVTVFSCANENCIDNAIKSVKIHLNFDLILIFI